MAPTESIGVGTPLATGCRSGLGAGVLVACLIAGAGSAGTLEAQIRDAAGTPLGDAVVSLRPLAPSSTPPPAGAVMDQRDERFVPYVLPVQRGTAVAFPNSDQIRHHVYSFSEPKRFELRLYAGTPAEPVLFDRSGTVVLGCNIHDSMIGFVRVVDTPWFAKSDATGKARIDAPAGRFVAELWHPRMGPAAPPVERAVEVGAGGIAHIEASLALGPEIVAKPRRRGLRDRAGGAGRAAP